MEQKIIQTQKEYKTALKWINNMFDEKVHPASADGQALQQALLSIKQYEDIHYPIPQ